MPLPKNTNFGSTKPEVVFCGWIWPRIPIARRWGSIYAIFLAVYNYFWFLLLYLWNPSHQIDQ